MAAATMSWVFEAKDCSLEATNMLLVRLVIGKVEKRNRFEQILRSIPIVQGDDQWNCVIWVKEALERLKADGKAIGTSQLDWKMVRDAAMDYVQKKREQHRFDAGAGFDMSKPATFDLLEGKETIP